MKKMKELIIRRIVVTSEIAGRGIKRGNNKLKVNIDFYFRLEDENYTYNSSELNLKIAEILNGYEKYLRKYDPEQDSFVICLPACPARIFCSRFHLKDKDITIYPGERNGYHPQSCLRFCANTSGSGSDSQ